jgi:hypothetical protein
LLLKRRRFTDGSPIGRPFIDSPADLGTWRETKSPLSCRSLELPEQSIDRTDLLSSPCELASAKVHFALP